MGRYRGILAIILLGFLSSSLFADNKYILSGGHDGTLKLWDITTGSIAKSYAGHDAEITSVAYSLDSKYGASGSYDKTAKLWDINSTECLKTFTGHEGYVFSVAFSPDGKYLASGSGDGSIRFFDINTGDCVKTLTDTAGGVLSISFSPDNASLLSCGYFTDYSVRLWNLSSGNMTKTLLGHTSAVTGVFYSPIRMGLEEGYCAISGSLDNTCRLWNINKASCMAVFNGHTDGVLCVAVSPDGRYGLSGGYDKTVKLWQIPTGECLKTFEGHTAAVNTILFLPDSKYAVSGSSDNSIMIWDISTGACVQTLKGQSDFINSIAVNSRKYITLTSPNGGEVWECLSQHNITWVSSPWIEKVNICYSINNGTVWFGLATGVDALSGYYTWTLPNTPSTQCLVEIQDASVHSMDRSDSVFTMTTVTRVITPNGGEEWPVDSLRTITWSAAGFDTVIVSYSTNAGTGWKELARCPTSLTYYDWTIPDEPSDQCLVKVSNKSGDLTDVSDAYFTIYRSTGFSNKGGSQYMPLKFSVSPNPFNARLRITLPSEGYIFSLTGTLIMKIDKGMHTLDTGKWGNGVYLVKCKEEVKRVVKIR